MSVIYLLQCLCILCRWLASYWHVHVSSGPGWDDNHQVPRRIWDGPFEFLVVKRQGIGQCNILLAGGLEHDFFFSMYWEFLHPNWRNHIFQRGGSTSNHKPDYIIIKCKDDGVGTLGWSISFSVYTDQHPSLTAKRLPWYQGLDPVPMWMMIKDPSKTGSDSGLSDMVNILPVLFLLLLLL